MTVYLYPLELAFPIAAADPRRQRLAAATSIPQCEPLNHAQMRQRDIFSYAPTSTGALAYAALIQDLSPMLAVGGVGV